MILSIYNYPLIILFSYLVERRDNETETMGGRERG